MTWERSTFRDLGEWFGGGTPSKANAEYWLEGEIPWLSPKDMGPMVLADTQDHITPAAVAGSSVREVPAGSVAVVVRSGILERTLPVALVPFTTTLNQDMKAVVPRRGVDPRWIAWGLRAYERDLLCDTRKAGTTVASIEMPRFYQSTLPVPELAEQRQIVDILEDHLSHLDTAERELQSAQIRAEALLLSALRRHVAEMRSANTAFERIGALAATSLGKMLDAKKANGEPTPYLANINVRWGRFDLDDLKLVPLTADERARLTMEPGDVIACEGGEPGRCAVWTLPNSGIAYQKALHRIRVYDPLRIEPRYLALMLRETIQSGRANRLFTGTTIKHLPQEKLRVIEIPVPSAAVQLRALGDIEGIADTSDRLGHGLVTAQVRGRALRQALLGAAFEGKLTGRQTDGDVIEATAAGGR